MCRSPTVERGNFQLNTSTQRCEREQQDTFLLQHKQSSPKFSLAMPVNCKHMTERKEKAGHKDTAALSSTEKWLVNSNNGKLIKLPWRLLHLPKLFNRCSRFLSLYRTN